ncbi:PBS lyase [Phormidesmis priestleyi ULC007]|uniref:PBS lyase n=1 Tax=Phormidesmis priestleyi ULC007 TaxID=1920490 RepID=A0A2T1DBT8_9CYAN|nr:HEAT repeat domain-containing protein [Phormidesmis priestleyi]PSB17945.1 PBS lyase [Phormidesmis priestleyi ULC007]
MVHSQGLPKQTAFYRLVFVVCLTVVVLVASPWVGAKEKPKAKPQGWQINGILAALEDSSPRVQGFALSKLSEYEAKDLKSVLKKPEAIAQKAASLLKDKSQDADVRGNAADALGNLGDAAKPFIPDIAKILKDKAQPANVRGSAAYGLGNLGDAAKPFIPDILNFIKDKKQDANVRVSAAYGLGNLGDAAKPFIPDILNFIKDKTQPAYVRGGAAEALGNLGDAAKPFIPDILNFIKDKKQPADVRGRAAYALGNLGDAAKPFIPDIAKILKDKSQDAYVRGSAASALGNLGDAAKPFIPDILNILKDKSQAAEVRGSAASALGNLGDAAKPFIPDILNILKDKSQAADVRGSAVSALGNLGDAAKPFIPDILNILKDKSQDAYVRGSAAEALAKISQLDFNQSLIVLDSAEYENLEAAQQWRFSVYFLSSGSDEAKTLLKWMGKPQPGSIPTQLNHDEGVKTLALFAKAWEPSKDLPNFRRILTQQIADIAKMGKWETGDIPLLAKHYQNLSAANSNNADSVKEAMNRLTVWQGFNNARNTLAAHLSFWLALIFAYPKFPQVQAIFFWNPWVRRILGMGYVGFLLTWVPFLRRKLFEPFKFSLLADSGVDRFNPAAYFPQSDVKPLDAKEGVAITTVIPAIKGQIVLEGDSGLGKSMFLRHLVKHSPRTVVFLPARKCEQGVIEAIQTKLHGQAQDAEFLKNLIYSGANTSGAGNLCDLCIDGLNEVTADTRAKITQFVESYFKGNIIMTTQPLEWLPPSTAKIYQLQPLRSDQIQEFLLSRGAIVAPSSDNKKSSSSERSHTQSPSILGDLGGDLLSTDKYTHACRTYLDEVLDNQQPPEELAAIQRTLSNPMDLTVVAQMIALGKQPNLLRLQEQQYNLMAADYQQCWNQDFPLKKFSEAVYQLRLNDEKAIPADEFYQELVSMEDEKYKMVVSRQWKDAKGEAQHEWYFRHDKIMEFFIVQTFLGDSAEAQNRLLDHMGDPRFRGVYFLLATLLPLNDAKDLRERLIQYAADTKDHTVSDTFVQLLRSR